MLSSSEPIPMPSLYRTSFAIIPLTPPSTQPCTSQARRFSQPIDCLFESRVCRLPFCNSHAKLLFNCKILAFGLFKFPLYLARLGTSCISTFNLSIWFRSSSFSFRSLLNTSKSSAFRFLVEMLSSRTTAKTLVESTPTEFSNSGLSHPYM